MYSTKTHCSTRFCITIINFHCDHNFCVVDFVGILESGGEIDAVTDGCVVHPFSCSDIADEGGACVDADSGEEGREFLTQPFFVESF